MKAWISFKYYHLHFYIRVTNSNSLFISNVRKQNLLGLSSQPASSLQRNSFMTSGPGLSSRGTFGNATFSASPETWLNPPVLDHAIHSAELLLVFHMDSTVELGKTKEGGVCLVVNSSWQNSTSIAPFICNPNLQIQLDHQILSDLWGPQEFTFVMCTYVNYLRLSLNTRFLCTCYYMCRAIKKAKFGHQRSKVQSEDTRVTVPTWLQN